MGKKRKSKKSKSQANKKSAKSKKRSKKVLNNLETPQKTDVKNSHQNKLTWFFKRAKKSIIYRALISFGFLTFCLSYYISYWPEKLRVSAEILGKRDLISNAIIFSNPNSYSVENVSIKIKGLIDATYNRGVGKTIFNDSKISTVGFFRKINSKGSKHMVPNFAELGELEKLDKCFIHVIYSLETPFYYPNIENEIVSFSGYLKPNGEVVYIYN